MLRSLFTTLLLAACCGSCAAMIPAADAFDVREVREFPEYRAWLPVLRNGDVRHDLVRAERSGRRLPATRDEARSRLATTRLVAHAQSLHAVVMFAAGATLMWPPVVLASAAGLYEPELRHPGASIEVTVTDVAGQPIPRALVLVLRRDQPTPTYLRADGLRVDRPAEYVPCGPGDAFVAALLESLPARLVDPPRPRECEGHRHDRWIRADRRGRAADVLHGDAAAAPGWERAHAVVLAWAPGFEPALRELPRFGRDVRVRSSIALRPSPDGDAIREAAARLDSAAESTAKASHVWFDLVRILHEDLFASTQRTLRGILADPALPDWLKANALAALERDLRAEDRALGLEWKPGSNPRVDSRRLEIARELEELRSGSLPRGIELAPDPRGPSTLIEDYEHWLEDAREVGLDRGEGEPWRAALQADLIARATELLGRCEALDLDGPPAEVLRCAIALGNGDVEEALARSRFLSSRRYFDLFYGRLRVNAARRAPARHAAAHPRSAPR